MAVLSSITSTGQSGQSFSQQTIRSQPLIGWTFAFAALKTIRLGPAPMCRDDDQSSLCFAVGRTGAHRLNDEP